MPGTDGSRHAPSKTRERRDVAFTLPGSATASRSRVSRASRSRSLRSNRASTSSERSASARSAPVAADRASAGSRRAASRAAFPIAPAIIDAEYRCSDASVGNSSSSSVPRALASSPAAAGMSSASGEAWGSSPRADAVPDVVGRRRQRAAPRGAARRPTGSATAGTRAKWWSTLPPVAEEFPEDGALGKAGGFSLHAGTVAGADERSKLERLCRYISRPALAEKRLSLTPGGTSATTSRRPGATAPPTSCSNGAAFRRWTSSLVSQPSFGSRA